MHIAKPELDLEPSSINPFIYPENEQLHTRTDSKIPLSNNGERNDLDPTF